MRAPARLVRAALPPRGGRPDLERTGERRRSGERARVACGVAQAAVAAHRQAGDRAAAPRGDRPVGRVDPRDELVDVVGLPPRLHGPGRRQYQSVYQPSAPPSGMTTISGARAVIACASPYSRPRSVVRLRPVQQVQDGIATARVRAIAGWQQDPHPRRVAQGRRAQRPVLDAHADAPAAHHRDGPRAGRRARSSLRARGGRAGVVLRRCAAARRDRSDGDECERAAANAHRSAGQDERGAVGAQPALGAR